MPEPLAANGAVVSFNVGVLLRLAWLDVFNPDVAFLGPCHERATDIFWTISAKGHDGLAALPERELGLVPHFGIIVVFCAKRSDWIKVLLWDGSGLVLCYNGWNKGNSPRAASSYLRSANKGYSYYPHTILGEVNHAAKVASRTLIAPEPRNLS